MADLTIIVPTRGRVNNALRLLEAFRQTCTADTSVVFVVSEDDPTHDHYYWHLTQADGKAVTVSPSRPGVVDPLNAGYDALSGSLGYAVGFMGDDHCPRTQGWDTELLAELRSLGTGVAYGNDLIQGEAMATAVVLTSDIPRALGYLTPPELQHYCGDLVWIDWGKGIDRLAYRADVIIEHLHPVMRKSRTDGTYRRTEALLDADSAAYTAYVSERLSGDLSTLNGLTEKPAPKKAPAKRAPAKKAAPKKATSRE